MAALYLARTERASFPRNMYTGSVIRKLFVSLFLVLLFALGCHSGPKNDFKIYPVRGKIVSIDAAKGSLVLNHEAIPGFMEAMTMSYKLKNPAALSSLRAGDVIAGQMLVPADQTADILLDQIAVVAQTRPERTTGQR